MKYLIVAFTSIFCFELHCQKTYVPDDNFELALIEYGYDALPLDNYVLTSNIVDVTGLELKSRSIKDLTGIQDFKILKSLQCSDNQISNLDLTGNLELRFLDCDKNLLTKLDLAQNSFLTVISCNDNQLSNLDLRPNTLLNYLECNNNLLTSINLSENADLASISCSNNKLEEIDVSKNLELSSFICDANRLTFLSLQNNSKLRKLNMEQNSISSINLLSNLELNELNCNANNLASIDLSKNTNLKDLKIAQNEIFVLELNNNLALTNLNCSNNQIKNLDLTWNGALNFVEISNNPLCTVDIKNNNNSVISKENFIALSTPYLTCITVDDTTFSETSWNLIDPISNFVSSFEECISAGFVNDAFELDTSNIEINHTSVQIKMNDSSIDYLYALDDGDFQESNNFSNLSDGSHQITVTSEKGCSEKSISFIIESKITVPLFFTPNNDGINDYWKVLDLSNSIQTISIYNRKGKFITNLLPNSNGWDGNYLGNPVFAADYWYSINFKSGEIRTGHFTLKR